MHSSCCKTEKALARQGTDARDTANTDLRCISHILSGVVMRPSGFSLRQRVLLNRNPIGRAI